MEEVLNIWLDGENFNLDGKLRSLRFLAEDCAKAMSIINHIVSPGSGYRLQSRRQGLYNVSCTGSEGSVSACSATNLTDPSQCTSNKLASLSCSGKMEWSVSITKKRKKGVLDC